MKQSELGPRARTTEVAVVLRATAARCEVLSTRGIALVEYGAPFRPRAESLAPGHLVAVTHAADGRAFVIWRWFDAMVLELSGDQVLVWEPAHGEVLADPREPSTSYAVGTRAYLSAGLPGAEWWLDGPVGPIDEADVDLVAVHDFYTEHDLWGGIA